MAPKQFNTLEEMEKVQSVIEAMGEHISEFVEHIEASESENTDLNEKLAEKKMTPEESLDAKNKINIKSGKMEKEVGDDEVNAAEQDQ